MQLQDTPLVTPEDFRRVLGLLKASFTHVLLDLSKAYSPLDMAALEESNHVLLVTQLDLPCLRNVVRLMMSFDEIDGLKEKTKIVVNRVGLDAGQIGLKKAQETIGRDIFWQIPNDYRTMVEVRKQRRAAAGAIPQGRITQAVVGTRRTLTGDALEAAAAEKSGGSGWLSFLSNRTSGLQEKRLIGSAPAGTAGRASEIRDRCSPRGLVATGSPPRGVRCRHAVISSSLDPHPPRSAGRR